MREDPLPFALTLTDTIIETASVFPIFGAGETRSSRRRDPLARSPCFFLSLFFSNLCCSLFPYLLGLFFSVLRLQSPLLS